jgi:WD40 repeat protein
MLLTGCADNRARLWDVATGKLIPDKVFQHQGWIRGVGFSPNGQIVLTSSEDKTARLWDVESGLPLGAPLRHDHWISSAVFSPDGRTVLTGSFDKTAVLWDVPKPLEGDPEEIELWVKVITGKERDPAGGVRPLDAATWQEYRQSMKDPRQ